MEDSKFERILFTVCAIVAAVVAVVIVWQLTALALALPGEYAVIGYIASIAVGIALGTAIGFAFRNCF